MNMLSAKHFLRQARSRILLAVFFLMNFHPAVADEWADRYRDGLSALNRGDWNQSIVHLRESISLKPDPEAQAATSSLTMVEYLPYYHLGQAYLFSGQLELASQSFEESLKLGAVRQTARLRHLKSLLELTSRLLQVDNAPPSEGQADAVLEERISSIRELIVRAKYNEASTSLASLKRDHETDGRTDILEKWLQSERSKSDVPVRSEVAESRAQREFRVGLDRFVTGQYEEALAAFRLAHDLDPDLSPARDWIQKTEAEISRLNFDVASRQPQKPAPEIIERTITRTTAPVIAIRSPLDIVTEIRSQTFRVAGQAGDDQGIDRIDITVNGKPANTREGNQLVIRPSHDSLATKLTFAVDIPVQLGENQVFLIAYDVDSTQHRTFEQFVVTRKTPIYQTSGFAAAVGATLILVAGGFYLSRRITHRLAFVNKYNPYIAGSPVRNEEMFFGREKLVKRILNTLHNNSLMIYGPRRIGKTSLQYQLKHHLHNSKDPEFCFIPVLIDLQGTSEKRFFATIMEEILEACKERLNGEIAFRLQERAENYSSRDFSHDIKKLLTLLRSQEQKKLKLVLLIDEVDELNKYSEQVNQRLRSVFMKTFAENLVAVMSGAHIRKSWESEGSPWYNFFEEIEVPPLEPEEAEALIRKPVAGIFSYDEAAIAKIIECSEGKPYVIQKFCVNVINQILQEKRRRVTVRDVDAVAEHVLGSVAE